MGCRADLQKPISLQYPKTLADHFKHAVTISDIPGQTRTPHPNPKGPPDSKGLARENLLRRLAHTMASLGTA
eukprot:jgi/Botrbrau1/16389/Bobra.0231s0005.1